MTMKVVKRDISLKELQNFNKTLAKQYLTYGVHKDKGVKDRGGINQATVASQIEFGAGHQFGTGWGIQPRPAIRTFLISRQSKKALLEKEGLEMARAIKKKNANSFWDKLGVFVADHIRNRILSGLRPSNRPSTIAKKGFDLPWVDSGELVFEDMEARVHR